MRSETWVGLFVPQATCRHRSSSADATFRQCEPAYGRNRCRWNLDSRLSPVRVV